MSNSFIRKMDEMEQEIALKSIRWSYMFTILALAVWLIYANLTGGNWQLPLYIIVGQNLINFAATQLYRRRVGDEAWKQSVRFMVITIIVLLLIGMAGAFFLVGK